MEDDAVGPPPDSARLLVRPMHRTDAGRLVQFHESLGADSQYLRFFSPHPHLSEDEVRRFTHLDHDDRDALVALDDDEIVGVARYDRMPGKDEAEVAFVVADRWQGRGLGTRLVLEIAALAAARGMTTLVAESLASNERIRRVFRRSGLMLSSRFDGDTVHTTMDITGLRRS